MPLSSLNGANIWLLTSLANYGNFTARPPPPPSRAPSSSGRGEHERAVSSAPMPINRRPQVTVDVVRLPRAMVADTDQTAWLRHTLGELGYDCVVSGWQLDLQYFPYARFLVPHHTYDVTLIASTAPVAVHDAAQMLFAWTQPFQPTIWVVMACTMLGATLVMYAFESRVNLDDFGPPAHNLVVKLGRGLNRALLNLCCVGGFNPVTAAGQTFGVAFSFCMLLLQSAYTANLAAYFTRYTNSSPLITSMGSFAQTGKAVCVTASSLNQGLVASNFPSTTVVVVDESLHGALDAVLAGTCAGVVDSDSTAAYVLGPGDPSGAYCSLDTLSETLATGFYAVPWSLNAPAATVAMLNQVVSVLTTLGDFQVQAGVQNFPPSGARAAACDAALALQGAAGTVDPLQPLSFDQMAGVFFVLAMGVGASLFVWGVFTLHERRNARLEAAAAAAEAAANPKGKDEGGGGGGRGRERTTRYELFAAATPIERMVHRVMRQARPFPQVPRPAPLGRRPRCAPLTCKDSEQVCTLPEPT